MRCRRGDVFFFPQNFSNNSHIQGNARPWVVVQTDIGTYNSPTTIVVPLTRSNKRANMHTHVQVKVHFLDTGYAICEQIRVVDKRENWKYVGHLPNGIMKKIDEGLEFALGLNGKGVLNSE